MNFARRKKSSGPEVEASGKPLLWNGKTRPDDQRTKARDSLIPHFRCSLMRLPSHALCVLLPRHYFELTFVPRVIAGHACGFVLGVKF